jgi:hypothetical protein
MRDGLRFLLGAWLALVLSDSAHAASIVPNPVLIANSADLPVAEITLVGTTTGLPAGGIVFSGTPAPSDLTLLLTVRYVGPGTLASSQTGLFGFPVWSSAGWIPGTGVDWTRGVASGGGFGFAAGQSAAIATGAVTDVLFISAASIDVGEVMIFGFDGGSLATYGEAEVTWVPEPGTLALLTGGLALLARASDRRSAALSRR